MQRLVKVECTLYIALCSYSKIGRSHQNIIGMKEPCLTLIENARHQKEKNNTKEAFLAKEETVSQVAIQEKCAKICTKKKNYACFQQSHKCQSNCDNVIVSSCTDISCSHIE